MRLIVTPLKVFITRFGTELLMKILLHGTGCEGLWSTRFGSLRSIRSGAAPRRRESVAWVRNPQSRPLAK